jgi:hypothetical protein
VHVDLAAPVHFSFRLEAEARRHADQPDAGIELHLRGRCAWSSGRGSNLPAPVTMLATSSFE